MIPPRRKLDVLCPVCFGSAWTDGTLKRWLTTLFRGNPRMDIVIATTDDMSKASAEIDRLMNLIDLRGCNVYSAQCTHPDIPHDNLGKAGYLKAWATSLFPGSAVGVCDMDLIFNWSPENFPVQSGIMMGEDAGHRSYKAILGEFDELNYGLLTSTYDGAFFNLYRWLLKNDVGVKDKPPWYDEVLASIAWKMLGGSKYSRSWNFSHWWLGCEAKYEVGYAVHFHGEDGKRLMQQIYDKKTEEKIREN